MNRVRKLKKNSALRNIFEDNELSKANSVSKYKTRTPKVSLCKDLVLTAKTRQMLDEAIGALRYHKIIYSDWGFDEVDPLGRNMVINFYGPPGVGKTLAAEALAGELGMPYIHLGISDIGSRFLGEASKNITAAFEQAATDGAVLFFDEADTLLGVRLSSVNQGIDNEINAMRSTMLIELERFEGVVIFATNFAKNYDDAFVSRIRYHVEFTLPDKEARQAIWSRFLVPRIPLSQEMSREEIVEKTAELTEGFSGRELRTVMRMALPRAMQMQQDSPVLRWEDIESVILDVQAAKANVGKSVYSNLVSSSVGAARAALCFS
ncbi:AAA family ATPase [Lysobacteraceae bacterium NML120232]|nr:AAA family ATPase [Xanthomonadaceae bacterium NML120232]PJK11044.1 AAA family ATPase [Xanthomonadaceae bacterium NML08-0793]